MTASHLYECVKVSLSEKWVLKYSTLGVPLIEGFPYHETMWMKWNQSLNDIPLWKDSLSEKWMLNYTTVGFSLIWGFASHERNVTHPLTINGGQVYDCEKSEKLVFYTTLWSIIKGFPSHEWNETHPLTMIAGQLYECEKFRFLKNEW